MSRPPHHRRGPPQDRRRVTDVIGQWPAEELDILWHAHYFGWTVEKIADRFDLSDDIVKLRLHDALQRLLVAIDGRDRDSGCA